MRQVVQCHSSHHRITVAEVSAQSVSCLLLDMLELRCRTDLGGGGALYSKAYAFALGRLIQYVSSWSLFAIFNIVYSMLGSMACGGDGVKSQPQADTQIAKRHQRGTDAEHIDARTGTWYQHGTIPRKRTTLKGEYKAIHSNPRPAYLSGMNTAITKPMPSRIHQHRSNPRA